LNNNIIYKNNNLLFFSFNKKVINLSKFSFDPLVYHLFEKGLSFATRNILVEEIGVK